MDEEAWYFVLGGEDGRTPVAVDDRTWSTAHRDVLAARRSRRTDPWRVDFTELPAGFVSTVFLGLRHDGGLFETLYCDRVNGWAEDALRCWTWADAVEQHAAEVARRAALR